MTTPCSSQIDTFSFRSLVGRDEKNTNFAAGMGKCRTHKTPLVLGTYSMANSMGETCWRYFCLIKFFTKLQLSLVNVIRSRSCAKSIFQGIIKAVLNNTSYTVRLCQHLQISLVNDFPSSYAVAFDSSYRRRFCNIFSARRSKK